MSLLLKTVNAKGSDSITQDDLAQPYTIQGKTSKDAILSFGASNDGDDIRVKHPVERQLYNFITQYRRANNPSICLMMFLFCFFKR